MSQQIPGVPLYDHAEMQAILRRTKFAHLNDEQFDFLIAQCSTWGLDPWKDHAAVISVPGTRPGTRNEIRVVTTLKALRDKAEATGEHRGRVGPAWCGRDGVLRDIWLDTAPPHAARVGIRREGKQDVYWGVAYWDFYCPPGSLLRDNEFWRSGGAAQLAKCAEALALRAAFPILGAIYTNDEMEQATYRRAPTGTAPSEDPDAPPPEPSLDDSTPTSDMTFQLRLIHDHDLGNRAEREKLIADYKARWPDLYIGDRRTWYAAVLRDLAASTAEPQAAP